MELAREPLPRRGRWAPDMGGPCVRCRGRRWVTVEELSEGAGERSRPPTRLGVLKPGRGAATPNPPGPKPPGKPPAAGGGLGPPNLP